ncbi:MAG: hypothetical protein ACREDY_27120 [Bradyrhizobium sp.]
MLRRFVIDGLTVEVDLSDREYFLLRHEIGRMSDAQFARFAKEAQATRGLSLRPYDDPIAAIVRNFYLANGRMPTVAEKIRRAYGR